MESHGPLMHTLNTTNGQGESSRTFVVFSVAGPSRERTLILLRCLIAFDASQRSGPCYGLSWKRAVMLGPPETVAVTW